MASSNKASGGERYHHGDLKQTIVNTALELIDEKGMNGFSLREVARRAGVSHGAPAHHFNDIKGLFTEIAVQGFKSLAKDLHQIDTGDSALDFREFGKTYVRFAAHNPASFEVMFQPSMYDKYNEGLLNASASAYSFLRGSAKHIEEKSGGKVASSSLALRAWSIAHGLSQLWLSGNLSPDFDPKVLEDSLTSVFDSLASGST